MDKFDVVVDGYKVEMSHEEYIKFIRDNLRLNKKQDDKKANDILEAFKPLKDLKKQAFWDNFSRAWVQTEPEELPDNVLQFTREKK